MKTLMISPDVSHLTPEAVKKVERIWLVGTCVYIAAAVFLVMAQILLPVVGALVVLICSMATSDFDKTLVRWLIIGFAAQAALAVFVLVGPRHSGIGPVFSGLALLGPLIAGAVVTRLVRRRAQNAPASRGVERPPRLE